MKHDGTCLNRAGSRLLSALMALVMAVSLLGAVAPEPAAAASWMEPYLQKLVSWGVMQGDSSGNLHPDRTLTRAEFVVLVNRAFGYNRTGVMPFKDVKASDWYFDDINIGYTTGYFNGTSKTTAAPRAAVTREQATVLLSRNLMLDSEPGAGIPFTDGTSMSNYSRGLIRSALAEGFISGYSDGSFRPKQSITRGQMAVLLTKAIGTPVNKPGEQTLGGVYGNVTISTSGVKLRNTTIAGNLYITGGLGLGDVTLENVTVLGKIVVCGAGESSKGDNSVVLRNVTAPTLIMDTLANNMVTVRAEGDTRIGDTRVRTPAYLEDATGDEYGFTSILVDGEPETTLSVAGNLKEIATLSNKSKVTVAKGSVKKLTVDETATESAVSVLTGAMVRDLNLDVGTQVDGAGGVENLHVNAAGSKVDLLPDEITIRPDITADIDGEKMDTTLAAESSADPRLLAGYPKATDLASTSVKGLFRTNKAGTVYWAVTSINDGSVGDADLLKPAENARIVKSGTVQAAKSGTDYTAAVSGLTAGGSYYLSAMLVDARDQHSPVKVVSFTTPDNTAPNFASGFPYLSKITSTSAVVTSMSTKTCRLYYALLPKGSTAPTAADFRSNAVSGNLGFGSRDVTKNVPVSIPVNRAALTELETYDLYLWLTDADGAHSSAVKKLTFATVDGTPPKFVTAPTVTSIKETSVGLTASLDEAGTIYWVAVKEGEEYPKPMNGQTTRPTLDSEAAKLQVANGMNALKSGSVTATPNKDVALNLTGLTSETAYDVYYVAQDKAGNYSAVVGMQTVHTLDTNAPTVTQEFTRTNDAQGLSPLADTDVRIVFSENVQDKDTNQKLLDVYNAGNKDDLAELLRRVILLYNNDKAQPELVADRSSDDVANWVIDYRQAEVTAEDGKTVVTFRNALNAIKLQSGSKYYFAVQNIADTSTNKNIIKPNPYRLDEFTTVFAQLQFSNTETSMPDPSDPTKTIDFDMSFKVTPLATSNAGEDVRWDLLFRMNIPVKFKLYEKVEDAHGGGVWKELPAVAEINSTNGTLYGASYTRNFVSGNTSSSTAAEQLRDVDTVRHYGIRFTSLNNIDQGVNNEGRKSWSGKVEMQVTAVAGSDPSILHNLAVSDITDARLEEAVGDGLVQIGNPQPYTLKHTFSDTLIPEFQSGYPQFTAGDVTTTIDVQLTRTTGRIYYVVAPVETITTTLTGPLGSGTTPTSLTAVNWPLLPQPTRTDPNDNAHNVRSTVPTSGNVMTPPYSDPSIIKGNVAYYGSNVPITLTGLKPETQYVAYFVLQGSSSTVYSENPYVFGFETTEVSRPIITLDVNNPNVTVSVNSTSTVDYLLAVNGQEPGKLRELMVGYVKDSDKRLFSTTTGTDSDGNLTQEAGPYNGYTVLQAMSEDYREGNVLKGSLFDKYATPDAKDSMANYIRSQVPSSGSVTLKQTITVPGGGSVTVDCSPGMPGSSWYTFLAVGKSSGSGDAFRAIRPVYNVDNTPPMITSCSFTYEGTSAITSPFAPCKGRVTLQFSEPLYWTVKEGVDQSITPVNGKAKMEPTSNYYPAGLAFERDIYYVLKEGSATSAVSSVTFTFAAAQPGSSIRAAINLSDKSGNVHSVPLSVELTYTKNDDNTYTPSFTITPEWDATGR